jgi:hypothetical protein
VRDKTVSLTLISESDYILATGFIACQAQLSMPLLHAVSLERSETQSGELVVDYYLEFETANFIRQKSYFLIMIPKEIALVDSRLLKCEEKTTGRTLSCRM